MAAKKKAAKKAIAKSLTITDGAGGNVVKASKWREDEDAWHVQKGTLNGDAFSHDHAYDKKQWSRV